MTVQAWLQAAEAQLKHAGSQSAHLDAQLLVADELNQEKTWLLAHGEETITKNEHANLQKKLARRLQREPMAYIRGKQEFYGRSFAVNSNVLIPRPETEALITLLGHIATAPGDTLIDVGTGSGCIAITAQLEYAQLKVYGLDLSTAALAIARQNAQQLQAHVRFEQADLLEAAAIPENVTIIAANLPYVDTSWEVSPETAFEPRQALFAENKGLALIFRLLVQAQEVLRPKGHLLLEADPRQHTAITEKATTLGFHKQQRSGFILHLTKA